MPLLQPGELFTGQVAPGGSWRALGGAADSLPRPQPLCHLLPLVHYMTENAFEKGLYAKSIV